MSKKRADRPTAARDVDDDEKQQSNKSARLDSGDASASSAAESAAAAASSAVSSAAPVLLSPAQRLYPDALLSVFGFLDLRDVIGAHASCRSWRDAAHKEPSRNLAFCCDPARLDWCRSSPLRHHVSEYNPKRLPCTLEQFSSLRAFPGLTRVAILVASGSLAPLVQLRGQARYTEAITATVAQWPPKLTYLRAGLSDYLNFKGAMQVLIDCIGRLGTLSELELPVLPFESLMLQPLLQLTRLRTLQLGFRSPSVADCTVIKELSSLTHLNLDWLQLPLEAVEALCTPPHRLSSLQRIDLGGDTSAAHMEALSRLPALSTLNLGTMDLPASVWLPRFTQLRSLRLWIGQENSVSACMPHLTQCPQLTALTVGWSQLTLADLTQLTRSLTALTSLDFENVHFEGLEQPDSLACLHSLPQLRELQFLDCFGVRVVHLTHATFTSLPSLRSLQVSLREKIGPAARALFKVPCDFMPQLLSCRLE